MVTVEKRICNSGAPLMRRLTSYCCDECETRCDPNSADLRDRLYRWNGEELCWDCLMELAGIEEVKEWHP